MWDLHDPACAGAFDAAADKQRSTAGRPFCRLRQQRAVATRYDKRDRRWRGTAEAESHDHQILKTTEGR